MGGVCPICREKHGPDAECVRLDEPARFEGSGRRRPKAKCPSCGEWRMLGEKGYNDIPICSECAGITRSRPIRICYVCQRPGDIIFVRADGGEVCNRCYHAPIETCIDCGKDRPVTLRTDKGPVCHSCYVKNHQPTEICIDCGKDKPVELRTDKGPICKNCRIKDRPTEICIDCGEDRPVTLRTDKGPVCSKCYENYRPTEICIDCGEDRPVKQRTAEGPVCNRCYQRRRRKKHKKKTAAQTTS